MMDSLFILHVLVINQANPPEVIDRISSGYNHFVIPFIVGILFFLCWISVGCIRLLSKIPRTDRLKLWKSLFTPKTIFKNLRDLFCDCLFHVKIWQRKPLLGYMHSAIAFGWFMLIILGHIEVALFVPKHLPWSEGGLFYPIFYRFFVWMNPGHTTLRGSFFFFLMDFFLLYVLTGIALAVFKRFRSIVLGMRHTTKPSFADRIALYSLWLIFPMRLLAESFTADLSGGSFLTIPVNHLWHLIFGDKLWIMPSWWLYSICLGCFFAAMPFSRYMHILTEVLWILLRNAGIKPDHPRKGVAEAEIYACSSCGLCLDACPMNVQKKNLKYSSVYLIRFLRRHTRNNEKKINAISDKCLMCDKCHALCPVGVDAPSLRRAQRATVNNSLPYDYSYLATAVTAAAAAYPAGDFGDTQPQRSEDGLRQGRDGRLAASADLAARPQHSGDGLRQGRDGGLAASADLAARPQHSGDGLHQGRDGRLAASAAMSQPRPEVMYFAGCMSHLTPRIIKSVEKVFKTAGIEYVFADRNGGICCGRPLMLAGKTAAAAEAVDANRKMVLASGCRTLVLSCPICYKIFKEEYKFEGIKVVHYTQFIDQLISSGKLEVGKSGEKVVYHDPCELGRGCGVYEEPRSALAKVANLVQPAKEYDESICCGGSLGSLTLSMKDRNKISESAVTNLLANNPQTIVTACPLCLKTFSEAVSSSSDPIVAELKVKDFAEEILSAGR